MSKRILFFIFFLCLLSSCGKDEVYNTPHPDRGAVTVSLTGLAADDNYVLDIIAVYLSRFVSARYIQPRAL